MRKAWLLFLVAAAAGAQVFSCSSSFTTSGTGSCSVNVYGAGSTSQAFTVWGVNQGCVGGSTVCPSITSGVLLLASPQTTVQHDSASIGYQTAKVNAQAFDTKWTFQPNGQYGPNLIIQNNSLTSAGSIGALWTSGAGGEQNCFQGYDTSTGNHAGASSVNNIFCLSLDSYSALTQATSWTCSSVQIYGMNQSPYLPESNAYIEEWPTNKISTCADFNMSTIGYGIGNGNATPYPISPSSSTGTADTFSAEAIYTGTIFTVKMYDVTAGGSCGASPANCFTYSWPVDIPAMIGGTTGYVSLAEGTGSCSGATCGNFALYVDSWVYTVLSAPSAPSYSVPGGSYSGTQTLTLTDAAPTICYTTNGTVPATNGIGGCASGTLYSGSISVSGSEYVKSVAGGSGYADSPVASNFYNINSTPDIPVPSVGGMPYYQGAQQVFLTAQVGATIRYSTSSFSTCSTGTLYSGAITVSSNETLYYLSCTSGGTASAVGSTAYVISPFAGGSPAGTPPASPTFSVAPGTYGSTQTVTLGFPSQAYGCYTISSVNTPPTLGPFPASISNSSAVPICQNGSTRYTGAITVSSSERITAYSAYDTTLTTSNGGSSSNTNFGPPSSPAFADYQIGAAAAPVTITGKVTATGKVTFQ